MNTNLSSLSRVSTSDVVLCGLIGSGLFLAKEGIQYFLNRRPVIVVPPAPTEIEEQEELETEIAYVMAITEINEPVSEEPTPWSVFTEQDDDWDDEHERNIRTSEEPYVIHIHEYTSNDTGYHQQTVTYYEIDDIMADMHDTPIYNWASQMGDLRWGHGSLDKNVVYIRNEKLRREWEVLLNHSSYEVEVQGLSDEPETEVRHSLRKFRDD